MSCTISVGDLGINCGPDEQYPLRTRQLLALPPLRRGHRVADPAW